MEHFSDDEYSDDEGMTVEVLRVEKSSVCQTSKRHPVNHIMWHKVKKIKESIIYVNILFSKIAWVIPFSFI